MSQLGMLAPSEGHPSAIRLTEALKAKVGHQRFDVWFGKSTRLELREDDLVVLVADDFISEWITRHYLGTLGEVSEAVLGRQIGVQVLVSTTSFSKESNGVPAGHIASGQVRAAVQSVPTHKTAPAPRDSRDSRQNSARASDGLVVVPVGHAAAKTNSRPRLRHELDNFIVGPGSEIAYTAVCHAATTPGAECRYNPLFIHGASGLGKTHLLQGLCNAFSRRFPEKKWAYMTGEAFTNEFLLSLQTRRSDQFRRKMRELDLLVIDDVHFLAGKTETLKEFQHTFDAIEAGSRQIVMASDAHPHLVSSFGECLVNRFVSGMVVRVDPPNAQTRRLLLGELARRRGITLAPAVSEWVAQNVTSSVRELEGAVTRIAAAAELSSTGGGASSPVSLEVASVVLADLNRHGNLPIMPGSLVAAAAAHFGVAESDLKSGRRHHTVSVARTMAMFLIRKHTRLSLPEIGRLLGNRNHSTVLAACRRMEKMAGSGQMLEWQSHVGQRTEEAAELASQLLETARNDRR